MKAKGSRNQPEVSGEGRVYVALSGGVDSSVAAALLLRAGYKVTGVYIRAWYPPFLRCGWQEERRDAMRVAARLSIPFVTLDLSRMYKSAVIDYMIREYKAGRTPNPDVLCNRYVKFGDFLAYAKKRGARFVATGHYARVRRGKTGECELLAGRDKDKDQSYFLWTLGQKELSRALFPVGNFTKPVVRELARRFTLPTAEKKDSQGVCFIGELDMKEFLRRYIRTRPGKVVDIRGREIGAHDGAALYTIGERRGFTVTQKTPHARPYYIVGKNMGKNQLAASEDKPGSPLYRKDVCLRGMRWVRGRAPRASRALAARVRYREPLSRARIRRKGGRACVVFTKPRRGVAPGQSCVFYEKEKCLGGGIVI